MIQDEDVTDENAIDLPLPITSHILQICINYCQLHHNEPLLPVPKPIIGTLENAIRPRNHLIFVNELPYIDLFQLALAANYLDIRPLFTITMARISYFLRNKLPEDICQELGGTVDDLFPEEFYRLFNDNKWTIDDA